MSQPSAVPNADLAQLLSELMPIDGSQQSALEDLVLMRSSVSTSPTSVLQQPAIVCIAQGRKRGYLGEEVFSYEAGQMLVVSVPMQFLCDTVVSHKQPMLACTIRIDAQVVRELSAKIQADDRPLPPVARGMAVAELGEDMAFSLRRLLSALKDPNDARALGPALIREVHYRVLQSPAGDCLRSVAAVNGNMGRIHHAIELILRDYARDFEMAALAKEAAMSVSAFYAAFRAVTGHSPLQYVKLVRLHQARTLILDQGYGAAQAAFAVGYGSANQFSREFKRLFGHPPSATTQQRGGHD